MTQNYRRSRSGYEGQIAGLYDLGSTLGKGHYAVVKSAKHVFTGEKVAVKVIDKLKLDDISRAHLFQEVRCMKLVQHSNVVRLYEVIDTQTKLYLVLEFGDGGDLYDYIMQHAPGSMPENRCHESVATGAGRGRGLGGLDELIAARHFHQISSAIAYCHRLNIVHRDIKPENCLFFNGKETLKLTDFGFSNKFTPGRMLRTSCGSLAYSAPEILLGDEYDPPAVDVWSLGVILFMLVTGVTPFQDATDGETLIRIMDCKYTIPPHVSALCSDLIHKMLRRDPRERPDLDTILSHPWVQAGALSEPTSNDPSPPTDSAQRDRLVCSRAVPCFVRSVPTSPSSASPKGGSSLINVSSRMGPLNTSGRAGPQSCRENLTDVDHCFIVQRIVDGKIATRDQIVQSLERSAYNHITATYDLLAEQILRKRMKATANCTDASKTPGGISPVSPLALNGPLYGPVTCGTGFSNISPAVTSNMSSTGLVSCSPLVIPSSSINPVVNSNICTVGTGLSAMVTPSTNINPAMNLNLSVVSTSTVAGSAKAKSSENGRVMCSSVSTMQPLASVTDKSQGRGVFVNVTNVPSVQPINQSVKLVNNATNVPTQQINQSVKQSNNQRPSSLDIGGRNGDVTNPQRGKRCSLIKEIDEEAEDEEENLGLASSRQRNTSKLEASTKPNIEMSRLSDRNKNSGCVSSNQVTGNILNSSAAKSNSSRASSTQPKPDQLQSVVKNRSVPRSEKSTVEANETLQNNIGHPHLRLVMPSTNTTQVKFALPEADISESLKYQETSDTSAGKVIVPERSLRKVASSPQLQLNQICEEEDEEEEEIYDNYLSRCVTEPSQSNESGRDKIKAGNKSPISINNENLLERKERRHTISAGSESTLITNQNSNQQSTKEKSMNQSKHRAAQTSPIARGVGISSSQNGAMDSKEIEAFMKRVKGTNIAGPSSLKSNNPGSLYRSKASMSVGNDGFVEGNYPLFITIDDYSSFMPEELRTRSLNRRTGSVGRDLTNKKPPLSQRSAEVRTIRLRDLNDVVSDTESSEPYEERRRKADRHKLRRFSIGERRGVLQADGYTSSDGCTASDFGNMDIETLRRMSLGTSNGGRQLTERRLTSWNSYQDLVRGGSKERELCGEGDLLGLRAHYALGCSLASELRQQRNEGMKEVERHRDEVNTLRRKSKGTIRFRSKDFGSLVDKFKVPAAVELDGGNDCGESKQDFKSSGGSERSCGTYEISPVYR